MELVDQMGLRVSVPDNPRRIVSLVPSQTELLYHLGLGDRVVGITKFCVHPEKWFRSKTRIGGTKQLKIDAIGQLQPDLILGNKEENQKEDIAALRGIAPVWMSDIFDLPDARKMILDIGLMTQSLDSAKSMVQTIDQNFSKLEKAKGQKVLYLIWRKPFMAAGKNTFIDAMLSRCGYQNVLADVRYPEVDVQSMSPKPDFIFLSSEPYPFKEKHMDELRQFCPNATIVLVDGEMFSWYGSRLIQAPVYFKALMASLESNH